MRLIDADAMKENVIDKTDGYYEYQVKQYHAWIDAQPTVEPKWIPVSEKLPETKGTYLVSTEFENYVFVETAYYQEGKFLNDDELVCEGVLAWMPLPEPYKEIADGKDD